MQESAIVAIAIGGGLALVAIVILALRARGSRRRRAQFLCGGCRRVIRPDWVQCLFCGYIVPAPVPRLEFLCGPLAGQTIPLHEEITTLGSVSGNSIVLADPAVSRKHLGIRRDGKHFEFADLGSTNGVYVNGHRLPKKVLSHGDIMRVGNTEMVFKLE
jgi:hypothetical protein